MCEMLGGTVAITGGWMSTTSMNRWGWTNPSKTRGIWIKLWLIEGLLSWNSMLEKAVFLSASFPIFSTTKVTPAKYQYLIFITITMYYSVR